jgi:hypothetical protein
MKHICIPVSLFLRDLKAGYGLNEINKAEVLSSSISRNIFEKKRIQITVFMPVIVKL